MVVGTGLLARAFQEKFGNAENVCIYAAGVSNSTCVDFREFEREETLLVSVMEQIPAERMLVYFSTCSIYDPGSSETPYVKHKLAMEKLVSRSTNYLIIRLPQAVGRSSNPHTLLNSFYRKISEGQAVVVWSGARRNVLDVEDLVKICGKIIDQGVAKNCIINVANPKSHRVAEIVESFSRVLGHPVSFVEIDRGENCEIDTSAIAEIVRELEINFDDSYLDRVVKKYYG